MQKDRLIELLEDQIRSLKEQLEAAARREEHGRLLICELTMQVRQLTESVHSLEEALTLKNGKLKKQENISRGLGKLISNESEKQVPGKAEAVRQTSPSRPCPSPKERGNNKSKRKEHFELEEKVIEVNPEHPLFSISLAKFMGYRDSIRYVYTPPKFEKLVYRQNIYSLNGTVFCGSAPQAPFLNSNYDGSFVAGLCQLRYIYSMSVERIIGFFRESGFELEKPTAHHLLGRAAEVLENLYRALRMAVLEDSYLCCDESYHKVLVEEKNSKGKGVRQGYIWAAVAVKQKLILYLYENGSRSGKVLFDLLSQYEGTVQSDAYSPYRKLESDAYPGIKRIACLQHVKRKFLEVQEEPDAQKIVELTNKLYQKEHEHCVGRQGWTDKDNLRHRKRYAPQILSEIKRELLRIKSKPDLLPKSEMAGAVDYMLSQWEAIKGIFTEGYYYLDNNLVERYNRYISLSRRNSLFFGSHKGAERGALFYSLACSCRMQGINTFEYITEVINKAAKLPPNTDIKVYRNLLPDKWKENRSRIETYRGDATSIFFEGGDGIAETLT